MMALKASVVHFDSMGIEHSDNAGLIVVIDVLRATTTIVCALANGARDIIPVTDIPQARRVAQSINGAVLGGEENNERPSGFDFGNSPQEYDARVRGNTVVLRTTNGTRVLRSLDGQGTIVCGAFANASAVVRALSAPDIGEVTFVCCGQAGTFSLEDFACAGASLAALSSIREVVCDDEAIAARELFRGHTGSLPALLAMGNHARALTLAGLGSDIGFAAQLDRHDVLPTLVDGKLVAASSA